MLHTADGITIAESACLDTRFSVHSVKLVLQSHHRCRQHTPTPVATLLLAVGGAYRSTALQRRRRWHLTSPRPDGRRHSKLCIPPLRVLQ